MLRQKISSGGQQRDTGAPDARTHNQGPWMSRYEGLVSATAGVQLSACHLPMPAAMHIRRGLAGGSSHPEAA